MSSDHVTSAGHDQSDAAWLDQHFNFSREAYEAIVRWVGFQPGWHVLDAGSGSGSFLPLIAAEIGSAGRLSALDLAPENVTTMDARFRAQPLACSLGTHVGSVLALPHADHTFDAVWSANVSQYLTDDELNRMLSEFKRVVKPGGLVAVKEFHQAGVYESTLPRLTMWRSIVELCRQGDVQMLGVMRAGELPGYLRAAGLVDVHLEFFRVDKRSPLSSGDRAFRVAHLAWAGGMVSGIDMPPIDAQWFRSLADPQFVSEQLSSPDYFVRWEYIQIVGRVP